MISASQHRPAGTTLKVHCLVDTGAFGSGVATAAASLTAAAGSDGLSVGVATTGSITFNGSEVGTLTSPEHIETYGIAVNYAGTTPEVTIMARAFGAEDYQLIGPIVMTGVGADLHVFAYGESQGAVVQQSINAGHGQAEQPICLFATLSALYKRR